METWVKPSRSKARRMAPTRPSIMSEGDTTSAPARACRGRTEVWTSGLQELGGLGRGLQVGRLGKVVCRLGGLDKWFAGGGKVWVEVAAGWGGAHSGGPEAHALLLQGGPR